MCAAYKENPARPPELEVTSHTTSSWAPMLLMLLRESDMGVTQTTATRGTHTNQPPLPSLGNQSPTSPLQGKQKHKKTARAAPEAAGAVSLTTSAPSLESPVGSSLWNKSSKSITPRASRRAGGRGHGCASPARVTVGRGGPHTLQRPLQVRHPPALSAVLGSFPPGDLPGFPPNPPTNMFHRNNLGNYTHYT